MAASEELARRVVEAGRSCSLTTAVLEEWSRLGTPKQVEYLAGYLEAERSSREASKRATLLRRCALPAPKTFDGYDWSAVSWPEGMGRESLLALDFVCVPSSKNRQIRLSNFDTLMLTASGRAGAVAAGPPAA